MEVVFVSLFTFGLVGPPIFHCSQNGGWSFQNVGLFFGPQKPWCWRVCDSTGKDELLETAMALHEAAMKDEYFVKRKLAPNVDFWYGYLTFPWEKVLNFPFYRR